MKYIIVSLLILFTIPLLGQSSKIDSLIKVVDALPNDTGKVMQLIHISNKYRVEIIQHAKAEQFAQSALELGKKLNFEKGIFKAYIALAYVTRDKGLHKNGCDLLKQAITYFENSKTLIADKSLHISWVYTYTALADLLTYLPDFKSAQQYAFKSIEISEKYQQVGIGQCWLTLSIIFFKEKNIAQANNYANKALEYFNKQKAYDDLGRTYAYLARYAYTQNDNVHAIELYKKSYDAYEKVNSVFGMRIITYNLAEIYLKRKEYGIASKYIDQTEQLNNAANDQRYLFYINDLKYKIEFENKQYNLALSTAKKLLHLAEKEQNLNNILLSSKYLLSIHLAQKDTIASFLLEQTISRLKDSLYNVDLAKSTDELARKYETKSKEEKILFLDAQNKLQQEKIVQEQALSASLQQKDRLLSEKLEQGKLLNLSLSRENKLKQSQLFEAQKLANALHQKQKLLEQQRKNEKIIRTLLFAIIVVALALIAVYYTFYFKQKKTNKTIVQQKEMVDVLLKEMHHRTKNNLQMMVSIMRLQKRKIQDDELLEVLAHSENRLQSVALIHEKLYKTNQAGVISLKEYLQNLAVTILQHTENDCSISFELIEKTEGIAVNIDTIVSIGLIVNELLTNAMKHAFVQISNPSIQIVLDKNDDISKYELHIIDNGIGMAENYINKNSQSIGLQLVRLITKQIGGDITFKNLQQGTEISLVFSV